MYILFTDSAESVNSAQTAAYVFTVYLCTCLSVFPSVCLSVRLSVCLFVVLCREIHDFCTLLGFGADAICPYLVYETMSALRRQNKLEPPLDDAEIYSNYIIAVANGIAKVMAKMGISTLHSYKASDISLSYVGTMFFDIV